MENDLFAQTPNTTINVFEANLVLVSHIALVGLFVLTTIGLLITHWPKRKDV